ncbi:MAG: hypothetical protein ACW98D_11215 [Promethearchaeota archaeon]|jgi:hypothetical protein
MKSSLPFYFKIVFLAGVTCLFVSLFVNWYTFQMFENGILTVSWNYNIFFEWSTDLTPGITVNENNRPNNLMVPSTVNFFFIGVLFFTLYVIFFKDLEQTKNIGMLRKFSLGFICLIVVLLFYIVIFPIIYLIPQELYFPSLVDINNDLAIRISYSISYGYILQIMGFLLIFPYSLHYYLTVSQFEKKENTPENRIASFIENVQESIDFDKYIAEEESIS